MQGRGTLPDKCPAFTLHEELLKHGTLKITKSELATYVTTPLDLRLVASALHSKNEITSIVLRRTNVNDLQVKKLVVLMRSMSTLQKLNLRALFLSHS